MKMESTMETFFEEALELPEVQDMVIVPKRSIAPVDFSLLKGDQPKANDEIQKFLASDEQWMHLLRGYAGTGKTTMISMIIEDYLAKHPYNKVVVTAPTNKAVKVARLKAQYKHPMLDYMTVHRLLGLKETFDNKTGKQKFVQDKKHTPNIDSVKFLVIDEVSQLNDDLWDYIYPYVKMQTLKLLFVGDDAQIPPVNKVSCIPLDPVMQRELGITVSTMEEVLRQAQESPIIELSMRVRKDIHRDYSPYVREPRLVNGTGYLELNRDVDREKKLFKAILNTLFTSENFRQDADFAKVVAYRNEVVNEMNTLIRLMIYHDAPKLSKIMIGEKLIANEPIEEGDKIILTTNDEFEVLSYEIRTETINEGQFYIKYYLTKVRHIAADTGKEIELMVRIVHEESEKLYHDIIKQLTNYALSQPEGYKRSVAWTDKYEFERSFANVGYNYAITAHKAQGSTYRHCLVIESDIDKRAFKNPDIIFEKNRIKYTAFTRPSHILYIVR